MKIKVLSLVMIFALIGVFSSCKKKGCMDPLSVNYDENAKKEDPDNPCIYLANSTAESKNVVLEEFTGIDCGFCPQGHLIAHNLREANPSDVVIINVHVGSYSTPDATGDADYRTEFGDDIKNQAGVAGYPAGTVNRHLFSGMQQGSGTAMSRSDWESAANIILSESSYVNVGASYNINTSTRLLTVNVEAYFTANGVSNNKINVALLQNNIEGNQSGSSGNPNQVLSNGNYNHNHMLRHLLTGQWGDDISTTTEGYRFTKTYTYTIPASFDYDPNDSYDGVTYDLSNLEVAVFVAEGTQEIISGCKAINVP